MRFSGLDVDSSRHFKGLTGERWLCTSPAWVGWGMLLHSSAEPSPTGHKSAPQTPATPSHTLAVQHAANKVLDEMPTHPT